MPIHPVVDFTDDEIVFRQPAMFIQSRKQRELEWQMKHLLQAATEYKESMDQLVKMRLETLSYSRQTHTYKDGKIGLGDFSA